MQSGTDKLVCDLLSDDAVSMRNKISQIVKSLGFEYFSITTLDPIRGVQSIDTRPDNWLSIYNKKGFLLRDPVFRLGFKNPNNIPLKNVENGQLVKGFTFEDAVLDAELDQVKIISAARDWGIKAGYSSTFRVGFNRGGMVHFYTAHENSFIKELSSKRALLNRTAAKIFQKVFTMDMIATKPILTPREQEVLTLVAEGKTSDVVGQILGISPCTIDAHVNAAGKKLGTFNRLATCVRAVQLELIVPYASRLPKTTQ